MALIDLCRQKAEGAWTRINTLDIPMNVKLAEAFAQILEEIWSQPWLGNATTRQLIDELFARIEVDGAMDYRTVDEPIDIDLDENRQIWKALKGEIEFVEEEEDTLYEEDVYED